MIWGQVGETIKEGVWGPLRFVPSLPSSSCSNGYAGLVGEENYLRGYTLRQGQPA